jgi:UDP-N-acetylglucosamine 3-dehydrogenase
MSQYRVGIIGTGSKRRDGQWGGIAREHAYGYGKCDKTRIVACADINPDSTAQFAKKFGVPATYTDHQKMLAKEKLDIVSVCTWPALHADITVAAAESGAKGILCEKPMAITLPEANRMVEACDKHGVTLSINHQRRLAPVFKRAKKMVKSGLIGKVWRVEAACANIYDWGTHWIDMMRFFNDDEDADWVLAGMDGWGHHQVFRAYVDDQSIAAIHFRSDVMAVLHTGSTTALPGDTNRIEGTEGYIQVAPGKEPIRALTATKGWVAPRIADTVHGQEAFAESVKDLVAAMDSGKRPELDGRRGRATLEIIIGIMESSRRRARVALPLDVEDNPLQSMIAAGDM